MKDLADTWVGTPPGAKQPYLAAFDATSTATEDLIWVALLALGVYVTVLAASDPDREHLRPLDRLDLGGRRRAPGHRRTARARVRSGIRRRARWFRALPYRAHRLGVSMGARDAPERLLARGLVEYVSPAERTALDAADEFLAFCRSDAGTKPTGEGNR